MGTDPLHDVLRAECPGLPRHFTPSAKQHQGRDTLNTEPGPKSLFRLRVHLARRTCGSRILAACSYAGAIIRQGPHHGAQKSTTSGMSLRVACMSKSLAVNAIGCPVNSCSWHWPHFEPSTRRMSGTRLMAWHRGHTICRSSLMTSFRDTNHYANDTVCSGTSARTGSARGTRCRTSHVPSPSRRSRA